jgi:putative ABC transport system substrate-binding protein
MNKRKLGSFALCVMLFALSLPAQAQQPVKVPRIGNLNAVSPADNPHRVEAFRQGLRELGYVEGKNIVIEWRFAEGKLDRLPALATELVRLNVDVIVTAGPTNTRAAKEVTTTIPIVMAQDSNPVGSGHVASLARPGGNITGLSALRPELTGTQLELLKEIFPRLSRVVVLGTSTNPGNAQVLRETELAAGAFGAKLQYLDVLDPKDIQTAFRAATKGRADALILLQSAVLLSQRTQIADLAAKNRLPAIYAQTEYTEAGGLMYYGANTPDLYRRAATYVVRSSKGRSPPTCPWSSRSSSSSSSI